MNQNSDIWYLENVNLYNLLCPTKEGPDAKKRGRTQFKKGEFIYFPNDASDKIYFIDEGRVKIGTYSDDGKEIIKAILQRGEVFGELAIVGEERRQNFAQAMDDVLLCERSVEESKALMMLEKDFSLHITKLIGEKLIRTERRLESLIFKDARTRIVEFLYDLAKDRGERVGYEVVVRNFFTHKEIANLTGTSRQTVTTVLNELRDENKIYFDRKRLLVRDMDKLIAEVSHA
jgi:CRP-like cAMP-binding protein